ncbi:MAG: hypothetical protein HQK89_07470 [Nitrospirae bacterium]|nr:hypothetical protein [Nitrospirota bacterium]
MRLTALLSRDIRDNDILEKEVDCRYPVADGDKFRDIDMLEIVYCGLWMINPDD